MKHLRTLSTVLALAALLFGVGPATAEDPPPALVIQLADEPDLPMPPPEGEEAPPQEESPPYLPTPPAEQQ